MQTSEGIIYAEVYTILNMLEEKYNLTIPEEISHLFNILKDNSYSKKIDVSIPLAKQEVNEETIDILNKFYDEYWANDKTNSKHVARLLSYNVEEFSTKKVNSFLAKLRNKIFKK